MTNSAGGGLSGPDGERTRSGRRGLRLAATTSLCGGLLLAGAPAAAAAAPASAVPLTAAPVATQADPSWGCSARNSVRDIRYSVNGGGFRALSGLEMTGLGSGDRITVSFTVGEGCENLPVSIAAYHATTPRFDPNLTTPQVLAASNSQVFSEGQHTLSLDLPELGDCFFQVDVARGDVLPQIGPAGTDNFYSAQDRLLAFGFMGTECEEEVKPTVVTRPPTQARPPAVLPERAPTALPSTGVPAEEAFGTGIASLVVGAWLVALGRRRRAHSF